MATRKIRKNTRRRSRVNRRKTGGGGVVLNKLKEFNRKLNPFHVEKTPQEKLVSAIEKDDLQKFKTAINNGANVNATDDNGETILMKVVSSPKENAYNIAEFLIEEKKVNINAQNNEGATALWYAALYGNKDIVTLLLSKKEVNINLENNDINAHLITTPYEIAKQQYGKRIHHTSPRATTERKAFADIMSSINKKQEVSQGITAEVGGKKKRRTRRRKSRGRK